MSLFHLPCRSDDCSGDELYLLVCVSGPTDGRWWSEVVADMIVV